MNNSERRRNGTLPEGWATTTIRAVTTAIQYGYTASASHKLDGPRFLRITDIQDNQVDWDEVPSCEIDERNIPRFELQSGDILFARTGATTGKSFLIRSCPLSVFASYLIRVRPHSEIVPAFLSLFFQTSDYWQMISDNVSGNAQPNCNATKLSKLELPLPPLAEQERIVAKVEALLERVRQARERLSRVPAILKKFRQSILAAACSGQLTEDWRDEHSDDDVLWSTAIRSQLASAETKEDWSPEAGDAGALADFPDSWVDARIGTIIDGLEQGWSPKCENRPSGSDEEWGVIKTSAVQSMRFVEGENKRLPDSLAPREQLELRAGDLLITRAGPRVRAAVSCLVRSVRPNLIACDKVYRFRPKQKYILPEFFELSLNTPEILLRLDALKTGISDSGLNLTQMKFQSLLVPLPPLLEQQQIMNQVQALFTLADRIEQRLPAATAQTEQITQSILAKAFSGELVETEAELARREGRDYEPASELLERIAKEREVAVNPKKKRRPKSSK